MARNSGSHKAVQQYKPRRNPTRVAIWTAAFTGIVGAVEFIAQTHPNPDVKLYARMVYVALTPLMAVAFPKPR